MLIIGIAGGTASGKTTLVNQIISELPKEEAGVISQDASYKNNDHLCMDERYLINYDHSDAIDFELMTRHLVQLKHNRSIEQPIYSFEHHNRLAEQNSITPKKNLIVEGILIFAYEKLRDLIDIKIFAQTDSDERLNHRLKRDFSERGRDMVLNRYQPSLKKMHKQFIKP